MVLLTVRTFLVLLQAHIHGAINKSMDAFAGNGSLFKDRSLLAFMRAAGNVPFDLLLLLREQGMI